MTAGRKTNSPCGCWAQDLPVLYYFAFAFLFLDYFSICCFLFEKKHRRPAWWVHENVQAYPQDYLTSNFEPRGYAFQGTTVSPQRFGKPMNRQVFFLEKAVRTMTKKQIYYKRLIDFEVLAGCGLSACSTTRRGSHGWGHRCGHC